MTQSNAMSCEICSINISSKGIQHIKLILTSIYLDKKPYSPSFILYEDLIIKHVSVLIKCHFFNSTIQQFI